MAFKSDNKRTDETATLLGYPISQDCRCGAKMRPDDRQDIVFECGVWNRICRECLNAGPQVARPTYNNPGSVVHFPHHSS